MIFTKNIMTKYSKDKQDEIAQYIRDGMTAKKAVNKAGISIETYHQWKRTKTEFLNAIKKAVDDRVKESFEQAKENSTEIVGTLYDLATGKAKKVKTVTKYAPDPHGNPVIVEKTETEETLQANVGAAIFILTNVDSEHWKNRQDVKQDTTGEVQHKGLNIIVSDEETADLLKRLKDK